MQNIHLQKITSTLLLGLFLLNQSVSYGQSRQRWSFGPRVGLNLTNFVGNDVISSNPFPNIKANQLAPGLSAGIGFIYSDVSRFGFGVDLLYSQRGSKLQNNNPNSPDPATILYRVNYLELPLTARYFLNSGGNFRPNIFLGAVPALRLNARSIASGNGINYNNDVTATTRSADLGLTAGFQLNWRTGNRQRFTVDARYTQGITNISTQTNDIRNQMITVGLGYNFGIGREYQPGDRKFPIRPAR